MKNSFSQLFLYAITGISAALVVFALVCLLGFKDNLMIPQILHYYGLAMVAGGLVGSGWYYFH